MDQSHNCGLSCLDQYKDFAPLVLRTILGIVFLTAAYGKIFIYGAQGFAAGLSAFMPFPLFFAWLVIIVEAVGGLFLLLGLWVRWVSVPLMITMIVAIATHIAGEGFASSFAALLAFGCALALCILGAGKWSIERAAFGKEC